MSSRSVAVLVLYNDKLEILLQHRSADATRLPNHWAFFGGGLEGEETPEEALSREIREELEYDVRTPRLVLTQEIPGYADSLKYVYVEEYDPSQLLVLHEGQGMKWWRFEDLSCLTIVDHDRTALRKVGEFLKVLC